MDIKKTILEKYQVRKSRKQKSEFIEFTKYQCQQMGYNCEINERTKGLKSRNIVVGDIEKARVIFTAHYDTCAQLPFPNLCTPLNPFMFIVMQLLISLPLFAIFLGLEFLFHFVLNNILVSIENDITYLILSSLSLIIFVGLTFLLVFLMICGKANKHTANDNTSGVVTLFEIMRKLPVEEREKAAFVLFDHEEVGLLGSAYFSKCYRDKIQGKLILNYDCVSDGEHFLFACKKTTSNNAYYQNFSQCITGFFDDKRETAIITKKAIYPSDQMNFKESVGIAALKKGKIGLHIGRIHTNRDTVFEDKNIELLSDCSVLFVNSINQTVI